MRRRVDVDELLARRDAAKLVRVLTHRDDGIRRRAGEALVTLASDALSAGDEAVVEVVASALTDRDELRVRSVTRALLAAGPSGAGILADACRRWGDTRSIVVDLLVRDLSSAQPHRPRAYEEAVTRLIADIGDGAAAKRLAENLRLAHDNLDIQRRIEGALAAMANPAAVDPLIALLDEPGVGGVAARVLGAIGDPGAVESLIDVLRSGQLDDSLQATFITNALEAIADDRIPTLLTEVVVEGTGIGRSAAAELLGRVGDDTAVEVLARALDAGVDGARRGLEHLGAEEARVALKRDFARQRVDALIGALKAGDERLVRTRIAEVRKVREAAVAILREISSAGGESADTAVSALELLQ